jgi:hypothetical protein
MYTLTPARNSINATRTVSKKIMVETDQRRVVSLALEGE